HEIVGEATEVGSKVIKFKVGDRVGVGCLVGSCHSCDNCTNNLENYCPKMVLTFGANRIPDSLSLDAAAPLLCAGITVYSPLRYYGLDKPGLHVGVVGLGGLGHVAVKFAKAMEAKVTVISTSPNKKKEAIEKLGADAFLVSHYKDELQAAMGTMDGIIDTVFAQHSLLSLIGRKMVDGSCIGWMREIQEMIDFAAKHNITAGMEVILIDYVNTAMERLLKADVKYRFVIDIANTLKSNS
ncbi:hypothetical protein SLEP1_g59177, partial [Rubroshorea leprosula]